MASRIRSGRHPALAKPIKSTHRPTSTLILNNISHINRVDHRIRLGGDRATLCRGVQKGVRSPEVSSPPLSYFPSPSLNQTMEDGGKSPTSPRFTWKKEAFGWRDGFLSGMKHGHKGYATWNSDLARERIQFAGQSIPFGEPKRARPMWGTTSEWSQDTNQSPVRFVPSMSPLGSGVCPPSLVRVSTPPSNWVDPTMPSLEDPPFDGQRTMPSGRFFVPGSPLRVPYDQNMRFSRSLSSQGWVRRVQDGVERSHSVIGESTGRLPASRKVVGDILLNYYPFETGVGKSAQGMLSPKRRCLAD